jgi:hypothetical protein
MCVLGVRVRVRACACTHLHWPDRLMLQNIVVSFTVSKPNSMATGTLSQLVRKRRNGKMCEPSDEATRDNVRNMPLTLTPLT